MFGTTETQGRDNYGNDIYGRTMETKSYHGYHGSVSKLPSAIRTMVTTVMIKPMVIPFLGYEGTLQRVA